MNINMNKRTWCYIKHKDRKYHIDDEFISNNCMKCRYLFDDNDRLGLKCKYPYPDECQKFKISYKLGLVLGKLLVFLIPILILYLIYRFFIG